jgi:hypothetical protein
LSTFIRGDELKMTCARIGWLSIIGMTTTGCIVDAASEAELGRGQEAIINGVLDEGDPAVVMLRDASSGYCTGTLISSSVVVTAAHCLDAIPATHVGFGVNGESTPVAVREQHKHPLWDGSYYSGHDVAVLLLASEVPGVAPVELGLDAGAAQVGDALRIIGYGHDTAPLNTGFGLKRQAAVSAGVGTDELFIEVKEADGTQTCFGDSGGPAMQVGDDGVERIVGVTSFGFQSCTGGGYFTRLAAWADFLADFVTVEEQPEPPPPPPPPPDTIAPTVSLVSPSNGRLLLAGTRSIVFEARDNVGVTDVVLNWMYNGKLVSCASPAPGWSCAVSGSRYTFTASIGSGTRHFDVRAHDAAGNSTQSPRYALRFW